MTTPRAIKLLVTLAVLVPATPAAASIPTGFASGTLTAAVDASGTGLFADTLVLTPPGYTTTVCRIPRGASACTAAPPVTFSSPSGYDRLNSVRLFPVGGSTVDLVSMADAASTSGLDRTYVATSSDGGANFSGPREIGNQPSSSSTAAPIDEAADMAYGPTRGGVAGISTLQVRHDGPDAAHTGVFFQLAPLTGSPASTRAKLFAIDSGESSSDTATVGVLPDGRIAVAVEEQDGSLHYRIWSGSGDPNSAATWGADTTIADGSYPQLLTSAAHLDLVYKATDAFNHWVSIRFDSGTPTAPQTIPVPATGILSAFASDRSGNIYAGFGAESNVIDSLSSTDGGAGFSAPVTIGCELYGPFAVLAVNGPNDGFLAWNGASGWVALPLSGRPPCGTSTGGPPPSAPHLTGVSMSPRRWRESGRPGGHRPPVGTTISLTLDQAATVTFTFTRLAPGRRSGHRCVAPTRHNRHAHRCTRFVPAGSLTVSEAAGVDRLTFRGVIAHRRHLGPGSYRASATASAGGLTSSASTLRFTIVRP